MPLVDIGVIRMLRDSTQLGTLNAQQPPIITTIRTLDR